MAPHARSTKPCSRASAACWEAWVSDVPRPSSERNTDAQRFGESSRFAGPMARLIDELKKLPGIGTKNAQRLAFYILRTEDADAEALAAAIRDVKAGLHLCSICKNITDIDPC